MYDCQILYVFYTIYNYQFFTESPISRNNPYEYEPPHDKTNKMGVHPAKTHISLGIRPV